MPREAHPFPSDRLSVLEPTTLNKWQIARRMTINLGFRFDRYYSFLPRQVRESAGGNPFNSANDIPGLETFKNQEFARRHIATFNNPVPRFAVIYDLFGDGHTAFSLEKIGKIAANFQLFNALNSNTVRGWTTTSSTTNNPGDTALVPTFRRATSILNPRIFRIQAQWKF